MATLYVTLEPCSHYGKTPPCANLVKESGYTGCSGYGRSESGSCRERYISFLKDAGIEVEVGVLEKKHED